MKNKKCLFVCSTQYAILNSINAVLNDAEKYNGDTDIVIFHQTDDIKKLSERVKESKIFGNVYDFPFINNINSIFLLILFVFPRFFLHKLCLTNGSIHLKKNHYNIIISQSQLYATLFSVINKNSDIYLLEDGISSYTGRTLDIKRRSLFFRLANKTFLRRFLLADIKGQLLYKPDMFCGEKDYITKLPAHKPQNNAIYNRIFEYRNNSLYNSSQFVYLGAPYYGLKSLTLNHKGADKDLEERCKFTVDSAMKSLKRVNFTYRIHPIEKIEKNYYEKFCKLDECHNMWEMECQNSITNDHILMSFFSTAAFTPKILYGKEPYVIFLHKITGLVFFNADNLIDSLQSMYSNPKKVMQPESVDELFEILKDLELKSEYSNSLELTSLN